MKTAIAYSLIALCAVVSAAGALVFVGVFALASTGLLDSLHGAQLAPYVQASVVGAFALGVGSLLIGVTADAFDLVRVVQVL